jgi:hypothetical protein
MRKEINYHGAITSNIVHTKRALLSGKCRKKRERRRDCREKEEIGKERNSRQAVCIYVQEEDTGEYN